MKGAKDNEGEGPCRCLEDVSRRLKKSVTAGGSDRSIRAVNNSSCSDWFVVKGRLVALRSEGKTKIINKTDKQAGVCLWNVMVAVVVLENGVRWCVVDGVRW